MKSFEMARKVLAVDATGCGLGTLVVLLAPQRLWNWLGLPANWRFRACGALAVTTAVLASGATEEIPSRGHLTRAAIGNAGWVAMTGALYLRRGRTWQGPGRVLVVAIMVSDAVMGVLQWRLRDSPVTDFDD